MRGEPKVVEGHHVLVYNLAEFTEQIIFFSECGSEKKFLIDTDVGVIA